MGPFLSSHTPDQLPATLLPTADSQLRHTPLRLSGSCSPHRRSGTLVAWTRDWSDYNYHCLHCSVPALLNAAKLHLVLRFIGGMHIFVNTLTGKTTTLQARSRTSRYVVDQRLWAATKAYVNTPLRIHLHHDSLRLNGSVKPAALIVLLRRCLRWGCASVRY